MCLCSCLGMEPLVMTYHAYIDQSKPFAELRTWLQYHKDNIEDLEPDGFYSASMCDCCQSCTLTHWQP